jgi:hypothetical protein
MLAWPGWPMLPKIVAPIASELAGLRTAKHALANGRGPSPAGSTRIRGDGLIQVNAVLPSPWLILHKGARGRAQNSSHQPKGVKQ